MFPLAVALGLLVLVGLSQPDGSAPLLEAVVWLAVALCATSLCGAAFAGFRAARRGGRPAGIAAAGVIVLVGLVPLVSLGITGLQLSVFLLPFPSAMLAAALIASRGQSWSSAKQVLAEGIKGFGVATLAGAAAVRRSYADAMPHRDSEVPDAQQVPAAVVGNHNSEGRTLWESIDADHGVRILALVGMMLFVLLIASLVLRYPFFDIPGGGAASASMFLLLILLVVVVGRVSSRPGRNQPVDEPHGVESPPEPTMRALGSLAVAMGRESLNVSVFDSDAINGYVAASDKVLLFTVSRGLTLLPQSEQEAAFALMAGRTQVDPNRLELARAGPGFFEALGGVYDAAGAGAGGILPWLDAAEAGDRQGLLILKDPDPILRLLKRLAHSDSVVLPGTQSDRVLSKYLAWPCPASPRALLLSDESGRTLTVEQHRLQSLSRFAGAQGLEPGPG